jgi:hypothetical protein
VSTFSSFTAGTQPQGTAVLGTGNSVSSITVTNAGASCTSGIQMQIADLAPGTSDQWGNAATFGTANSGAAYGYRFYGQFTDNRDVRDLVDQGVGIVAAIRTDGGDNVLSGEHMYFVPEGIADFGNNTHSDVECDSVFRDCYVPMGNSSTFRDTQLFYNTATGITSYPGAALAWIAGTGLNLRIEGSQCSGTESTWQAIYTGGNPAVTLSSYSAIANSQGNQFTGLADCRETSGNSFIGDMGNVFGRGFYNFGLAQPTTQTYKGRMNIAPASTTGDGLDLLMPTASYTGYFLGGWVDSSTSATRSFGITPSGAWQELPSGTQPTCSATGGPNGVSSEGTFWYTKGSGSTSGALQICQNQSGTYSWVTH